MRINPSFAALLLTAALSQYATATSVLLETTPQSLGGDFDVDQVQTVAQAFSLLEPVFLDGANLNLVGNGTDPFTFYITDAIGSGTTPSDVLSQATGTFSSAAYPNGVWVTVPLSLELQPGDYYLVLSSDVPYNMSDAWRNTTVKPPSEVGTVGNAYASCCVGGAHNDPAFPPDSTFIIAGSTVQDFQLTGQVMAPEPSSVLSSASGLLVLFAGLVMRRRSSTSPVRSEPPRSGV